MAKAIAQEKDKAKKLSMRQLAVVSDMFENQLSEDEVLDKHGLSKGIMKKWLEDPVFVEELEFRMDSARRQSRMIIARYGPVAAAKLVQLTECEKEETARKACLDIIAAAQDQGGKKTPVVKDKVDNPERLMISESAASRLLEMLASEKSKEKC